MCAPDRYGPAHTSRVSRTNAGVLGTLNGQLVRALATETQQAQPSVTLGKANAFTLCPGIRQHRSSSPIPSPTQEVKELEQAAWSQFQQVCSRQCWRLVAYEIYGIVSDYVAMVPTSWRYLQQVNTCLRVNGFNP